MQNYIAKYTDEEYVHIITFLQKFFLNSLFDHFLFFPVDSMLEFSHRIIMEIRHQCHVMIIQVGYLYAYYVNTFYD